MRISTVGPSFKFQGKTIRRQKGMFYWFVWGYREFDIRNVRERFTTKRELQRDMDYRLNQKANGCCPVFAANMQQLKRIVGETKFENILDEIDATIKEPF